MDQEEDPNSKLANAEAQESQTPVPQEVSQPKTEQRTVEAQTSTSQAASTQDAGVIVDKCPCSVIKMKKYSMKRLRRNGPCGRCTNTQRCQSDDMS